MGRFNGAGGKKKYLRTRARIRRAIDLDNRKPPAPHTDQEISAAAKTVDRNMFSSRSVSAEDLGLDPARVASAWGARLSKLESDLRALLDSELGRVAAEIEVWPEVSLAQVALDALTYVTIAPDGLNVRCTELSWDLDGLNEQFGKSGELGRIRDWAPRSRKSLERESERERVRTEKNSRAVGPLVAALLGLVYEDETLRVGPSRAPQR